MKTKGRATPIDKLIGKRIKETRSFFRITQQELASKLGITFQQLQKYESGGNRVSVSRLIDIAEVFNLSIMHFIPEKK